MEETPPCTNPNVHPLPWPTYVAIWVQAFGRFYINHPQPPRGIKFLGVAGALSTRPLAPPPIKGGSPLPHFP
eukprot:6610368-Pyramimonas_sp.AAC.1